MGDYADQFKLAMSNWNNMYGTHSTEYVPSPMLQNNNMYSWDSSVWGSYNPIFGNTQSNQPKKELTEKEKREIHRKEIAEKTNKQELIEKERRELMNAIDREATKIKNSYIIVPYTTPFAIMYLATEGLYAEIASSRSGT